MECAFSYQRKLGDDDRPAELRAPLAPADDGFVGRVRARPSLGALTAPGVVVGFGNINSNGLVFSANGQRARSNNFLLDGQDNNDPSLDGPGYLFSNLEAVGEFQVITNQYGQSSR